MTSSVESGNATLILQKACDHIESRTLAPGRQADGSRYALTHLEIRLVRDLIGYLLLVLRPMNPGRALEAECSKCGPFRIMLPLGQEPEGRYVRCPFCRKHMAEWRWIAGTAHTTHSLPYAERLGMTQVGPKPEQTDMEDDDAAQVAQAGKE